MNQVGREEGHYGLVCSLKHDCNGVSLPYNVQVIYDKSGSAAEI